MRGLTSLGIVVTRYGLATVFIWVGGLKFKDYEAMNAGLWSPAAPLTSTRLRAGLGSRSLSRLVGSLAGGPGSP